MTDLFQSKLEGDFLEFHKANPSVYKNLVKFAREWLHKFPASKLGIAMLYERVRWECSVESSNADFKLNNNHRAFYSRIIMGCEPDLRGVFKTREQKHNV